VIWRFEIKPKIILLGHTVSLNTGLAAGIALTRLTPDGNWIQLFDKWKGQLALKLSLLVFHRNLQLRKFVLNCWFATHYKWRQFYFIVGNLKHWEYGQLAAFIIRASNEFHFWCGTFL
jgi:hypothetical protein